jgi:hypothetical protein
MRGASEEQRPNLSIPSVRLGDTATKTSNINKPDDVLLDVETENSHPPRYGRRCDVSKPNGYAKKPALT